MEDGDKDEDKDEELDENPQTSGEPLVTLRPQIQVTRKKKLVTTFCFFIHLIATLGFLIGLIVLYLKKSEVINRHNTTTKTTFIVFYLIYVLDIFACLIGIWTCMAKKGSTPMLVACCALILLSLVTLFMPVDLFVSMAETANPAKEGTTTPKDVIKCENSAESIECQDLKMITYVFASTYILIVSKIVVIIICRLNYPHVFNWTHGMEQERRSDSILITNSGQSIHRVHSQTIAPGMFFSPVDINRMSLRGSLPEGEIYRSTRHGSLFVGPIQPRSSTISGRASMSSHARDRNRSIVASRVSVSNEPKPHDILLQKRQSRVDQ